MDSNLLYEQIWEQLSPCNNITEEFLSSLRILVYQSYWQNRFSKPMPWIGIYIAVASLLCILAMVADLVHGLRNRKLWFPCKYFTLNAASLTVIAVAIKLPMDLTDLTQAAKLGSLAFMCTMMANLLPSLAIMDTKELVANLIALGVLVITLVVNVCIQINTGVFSYDEDEAAGIHRHVSEVKFPWFSPKTHFRFIASAYVGVLLMLSIIYICSSSAILKSKQILESKYQTAHQTNLKDQELQPGTLLTVEKLTQLVKNYSILAETGSPQFMIACSVTTSASGVICALTTLLHIPVMLSGIRSLKTDQSDYKWSMLVILIIQFVGVILGTTAPLVRCFAALNFKLSIKWIWKPMKMSRVETYWTYKLSDWKHSRIPFLSGNRKCNIIFLNLKFVILSICIGFQKTVVVTCKMMAGIPLFFGICTLYCVHYSKQLKTMFNASGMLVIQKPEQLGKDKDLSPFILQVLDDVEFAERTLKGISKSVNRVIRNAEKQQPNSLRKLLSDSKDFKGVENFDSQHVPPLLSEEYTNCWSLPLVTLTAIAMSLPNIQKNIVDCLVSGVSEGLVCVTLVEENLNTTIDHVSIQKAAQILWLEVEVYHKWLGNKLQRRSPQVNSAGQVLQWLSETAKKMVIEAESMDIGVLNENSRHKSISANSMYRITQTLLLSYHTNIDQVSQEELFVHLSSMISDILAACLTNLPNVIAIKCHTSVIEERESSVRDAALLLGKTKQIINTLQERDIPGLNSDELAFIDRWRAYLKDPLP